MITGHIPIKEITRNRKRPKKTSTNSIIVREIFDGQYRKKLEIPTFINCYNYYMNSVDVANQLRVIVIVHFSRNEKEFFPGIF
jgi:fructose-1,6-bisphosphatase